MHTVVVYVFSCLWIGLVVFLMGRASMTLAWSQSVLATVPLLRPRRSQTTQTAFFTETETDTWTCPPPPPQPSPSAIETETIPLFTPLTALVTVL
jgi:hypothetical protein